MKTLTKLGAIGVCLVAGLAIFAVYGAADSHGNKRSGAYARSLPEVYKDNCAPATWLTALICSLPPHGAR